MADYDPLDAASWTAIIEAANSRRNFISGLPAVSNDTEVPEPILRELFGGYHVSSSDGFSFRGDVRWPFFLDKENPVAYSDFSQQDAMGLYRDSNIRGWVPEFYRVLTGMGQNNSLMSAISEQQSYKELVTLYPNFFIRKPSGTVLADYADFLRDTAGVISEMAVTPLYKLRWPGATIVGRRMDVQWLPDDSQLLVTYIGPTGGQVQETLGGFTSKSQTVDWMKQQWLSDSQYVIKWGNSGVFPGTWFNTATLTARFATSRSSFTGGFAFAPEAQWLEFTAGDFAADVPVRTWCINAPTTWNPPRYDSFDYDRPVSGTYGDVNPGSSPDWKYLISTVDSYVIGNLSSDFTLGATFPFPTVIPDADYGNSIEVGYVVPYSLYAADLSNAVIHLE